MGFSAAAAIGLSAAEVGTTAAVAAGLAGDVIIGAGVGALGSEVTGGDPGMGALTGGITGGFGGVGGLVGPSLGIGAAGGAALGGAAGGAIDAGITGGNPLTSALEGGAVAGGTAALGSAIGGGGAVSPTGGEPTAGSIAAGAVAPASVPASSPDVTFDAASGGGAGPGGQINPATGTFTSGPDLYTPATGQVNPLNGTFNSGPDLATGLRLDPTGLDTSGVASAPGATGAPTDISSGANAAPGATGGPSTPQVGGGLFSDAKTIPSSDALLNAPSSGGGSTGGGGSTTSGPSFTNTTGQIASQSQVDSFLKGGSVANPSPTTGGAGSSGSFTNFIKDPTFGNFESVVGNNIGAIGGAGILGYEALTKPSIPGANAASGAISADAAALGAQGQQLQGYLQSGTLPPGVQGGINQATEAAKATIRSQYASRGMSGSSAEQQDLANVDRTAQTQGANIALQLLNTGISETGLSSQLYQAILQQSLQSDAALSESLGSFAAALAGGGGASVVGQAAKAIAA